MTATLALTEIKRTCASAPAGVSLAVAKRIELTASEKFKFPISIDLTFVTSGCMADMRVIESVMRWLRDAAHERFTNAGFQVMLKKALVRPMSRNELLALIPRKIHYEKKGRQICTTSHVSGKNLTKDKTAVTCKLCLHRLDFQPG